MRRNITLVLAVVMTIGGSRFVVAGDLQRAGTASTSDQAMAADPAAAAPSNNPTSQNYRGFLLDLTEITDREDYPSIVNALRHQVDIVEGVGLSQRVLQSFHTVPILVDEFGCLGNEATPRSHDEKPVIAGACYGLRVPGSLATDEDMSRGVVMVRPITLTSNVEAQRPTVLHELLHFYHAHIFPQGIEDPAVRFHYEAARSIYQPNAYALSNEREFFAVTASIFLYGSDIQNEPFTRVQLKEKQPDYYKYLVWLFGFEPGGTSRTASTN